MQINDPTGPNRVVYRVLSDGEIEVIGGTLGGRRKLLEGVEDDDNDNNSSTRTTQRPINVA